MVKGFHAAFLADAKSEGWSLLKEGRLWADAAAVGAAPRSPVTDCASGRVCAKLATLGVVGVDMKPDRHPVLTPRCLGRPLALFVHSLMNNGAAKKSSARESALGCVHHRNRGRGEPPPSSPERPTGSP